MPKFIFLSTEKTPYVILYRVTTILIMFDVFDVLIHTILTYGSDIWGKLAGSTLDKVFLNYNRCTLHIKATTCNTIVNGECGKFQPSVHCHINVLTYYHRLLTMSKGKVMKSVFNTLYNLNAQGFQTSRGFVSWLVVII